MRILGNGDSSLPEFTRSASAGGVLACSLQREPLARLLVESGARAQASADGSLAARGISAADIGDLAARHAIALHQLVNR